MQIPNYIEELFAQPFHLGLFYIRGFAALEWLGTRNGFDALYEHVLVCEAFPPDVVSLGRLVALGFQVYILIYQTPYFNI